MAETWLMLNSGASAPAWNMALDEALLLNAARLGQPILRFYSWTESAATFGFFQNYELVAHWTPIRPLLRRPTGGGLVPHLADWTYSLAFPPGHPWFRLPAVLSYQRLHGWIQSAFSLLGAPTELCPETRKEIPGQCFAGAEKYDLLWLGRKIAGAAQRRTKQGLLIQGSVQPQPPGVTRGAWEQAMGDAARRDLQVVWQMWHPDALVSDQANVLCHDKYGQDAYHQRR